MQNEPPVELSRRGLVGVAALLGLLSSACRDRNAPDTELPTEQLGPHFRKLRKRIRKHVPDRERRNAALALDLSQEQPAKLAELQALFMQEAEKNHVLPIDDRTLERFDSLTAGRPDLLAGRTSLTVYPGMVGMLENAFINLKSASFTLTAGLDVVDAKPHGTVLAQGGRFGGWSLYVDNGKPAFTYNYLGLEQFTIAGDRPLPRGEITLRFEFAHDGGRGAGGEGKLFVNEEQVASGRIEKTQPYVFSLDETADVGVDLATGVVESIGAGAQSRFTGGQIRQVTIDVDRREHAGG